MKQWIKMMGTVLCMVSMTLQADSAPMDEIIQETPAEVETVAPTATSEQAPKQVGKASIDSSNAAKSNNVPKYVLAASAIIVGIAAIILISRHDGHQHHHSSGSSGGGDLASHSH